MILLRFSIIQQTSSKILNFLYTADGTPYALEYSTDSGSSYTTYYYLTNLQGDIISILNSSGTAVVTYNYDSWGELLSTTGTLAATLGTDNPLRYRGYCYDDETELYYVTSRYYNPEVGRFIHADGQLNSGPLGENLFAYCLNNPVAYYDPEGNIAISSLVFFCGDPCECPIDSVFTGYCTGITE